MQICLAVNVYNSQTVKSCVMSDCMQKNTHSLRSVTHPLVSLLGGITHFCNTNIWSLLVLAHLHLCHFAWQQPCISIAINNYTINCVSVSVCISLYLFYPIFTSLGICINLWILFCFVLLYIYIISVSCSSLLLHILDQYYYFILYFHHM